MMKAGKLFLAVAAVIPFGALAGERPDNFIEPPMLAADVAAGKLPPLGQRIPENPFVVDLSGAEQKIGRYGGSLRLLMGRKKDTRQITVYGYGRLVGYDKNFKIVPDILEKIDVKEGRVFTLHLRKGHRWSDGHPFTAEDFRFYWEDVATNRAVSNESPPLALLVDGERPEFQVIDEQTVRYTWTKPNPFFLPRLAGARPMYIYRPAHYLKKFNAKYEDVKKLEKRAKKMKKRNWVALHYYVSQQYKNVNPDLPSLQPWVLKTRPPAKRFTFERNPYYHRIDSNGRQLPYIGTIKMNITSAKLIPLKTGAGDSDLQARGLNFSNYTVLKQYEAEGGFTTYLWRTAKGTRWALYPNLNYVGAEWRKLFRTTKFRRALSLSVDRHEINQVIFYGLARETANTMLPESSLYEERFAKRWADFDIKKANKMLDELGLTKRNSRGIRLLPNGEPMDLTVVFSTENSEPADLLELIRDSWKKIGIKIFSKPLQRDIMRNRIFSGLVQMSMWSGLENGIANAGTSPKELAPTSQQQLQWPKWGQFVETGGKAGQAIDMVKPKELFRLSEQWRRASDDEERRSIWRQMLDLYTDEVYAIGIIASVPQVVVASTRLRNVPRKAIYNWDPGAHFGVHRPDTFWFVPAQRKTN